MRNYRLFWFCLLFFSFLSCAFAIPPQQIVFFGDSLTDNGNLFRLDLHLLPKSPPYFAGRFSNGPTWAEDVAQTYANESHTKYSVYAWGGATTIGHNPFTQLAFPITLTVEVDRYLLDNLFRDKSNTLFSFWIGGNDYLFDSIDEIDPLTTRVIEEISWALHKLINDGGKQFLVLNLPDLGHIPLAGHDDQDADRLHLVSITHNQKLGVLVKKIQAEHPEINLVYIDIGFFFDDLLTNPQKYNERRHVNIKDTTHPCWQGPYFFNRQTMKLKPLQKPLPGLNAMTPIDTLAFSNTIINSPDLYEAYNLGVGARAGYKPCENPDEYIFWDTIHPTGVAHRMIAARVLDDLAAAGLR